MPAPAKVLHVLGLLAKVEATYGTAIAMTTTADGVLLQYADKNVGAPVMLGYANDGTMGPSAASLVNQPRTAPTGRSLTGDLPMRFAAPGTTFAATVVPSIHVPMQAAGYNATLVSGAYTYTPTPPGTTYKSMSVEMYVRGEKWNGSGVLANLQVAFPDAKPPLFTFASRGISDTEPVDTSAPSIAYPTLPAIPLGTGVLFTFGSFTASVLYNGSFDLARDLETARVALTQAGGHLGNVPGLRNPQVKVVIEQTAFTTATPWHAAASFNPYKLRAAGTQLAFLLKHTDSNYTVGNSIALSSAQAQIVDVVPNNQGAVATVELTFEFKESTPGANDDHKWIAQ